MNKQILLRKAFSIFTSVSLVFQSLLPGLSVLAVPAYAQEVDSVLTTITAADTAYATGTAAQILASASLLDAFNNSGDTIIIGNAGKATPKASQALADLVFWNTP